MSGASTIQTMEDVGAGAILADKYRVVRVLGRGGMGVVVEAIHTRLGEHVAIKFLAVDQLNDKEARERFAREARATVQMRSPHVARVRDIGELATGQPYIVMELLIGDDLGKVLAGEAMAPNTIVDLMLQACEALAEAHSLGIVHRDIKPANLFITRTIDGHPHLKLLDFGVATGPRGELQLTSTGIVMGTPAYMCPEQMRSSREAQPVWDLWALGVVMFEAFEGAHPFVGDSFAELAVSVLTAPPAEMVRTPPQLREIILRCLEKAPENRFDDAAELAEALAPFASTPEQAAASQKRTARALGRAQSAPIVPLSELMRTGPQVAPRGPLESTMVPTAAAPSEPPAAPPPTIDPVPQRRRGIFAALAAVGLVGALAGFLLMSRGGDAPAAPDAAPAATVSIDARTPAVDPIDAHVPASAVDASEPADAAALEPKRSRKDAGVPPRRDAKTTAPIDAAVAPAATSDAPLTDKQLMQGRN